MDYSVGVGHRQGLIPFLRFIRFSALGGTLIFPLLGAASVSPALNAGHMLGLLAVAFAFHNYAYVMNDVLDLPIDRTEPRRAEFPLVRGSVQPWQALVFAFSQIPLSFALTMWLGGSGLAYGALSLAFALMAVYNTWGKRAAFPPLTDAIQGLAWGALVVYGAALVSDSVNFLACVLSAYLVVFIMLANGAHGSLRDLHNDFACGVRSTAIFFGARPKGVALILPRRLLIYALALQLLLISLTLVPLIRNDFGYSPQAWRLTTAVILILAFISVRLLKVAADLTEQRREMLAAGMLHLILMLAILLILFAWYVSPSVLAVMVISFFLPLLTHSWLPDMLRWSWLTLTWQRSLHRPTPTQQNPLKRLLDGFTLFLKLLTAAVWNRRRYPLVSTAFLSALLQLPGRLRSGGLASLRAVTDPQLDRRDQIDWFLAHGWEYAERRLQLLQRATDFPMNAHGAELLIELRRRMEGVQHDSFEHVLDSIYRDPLYPVYQHICQAFQNHTMGRQAFVFEVLSALPSGPQRVCDVGCGAGILLGDVLERYAHAYGYGVDVSDAMLAHAWRVLKTWGLADRAALIGGDLRHLPLPDGAFDFVIATEIVEHLPDPALGFAELARILTSNGWLVTSIPIHSRELGHLHIFNSVEQVLELHRCAGLTVERWQVMEIAPGVPNVHVAARRGVE